MRKGLLIVIAVLCSMLAQAEGVSREAAMRTAAAFLQGKGLTMSRATMAARAPRRNAPNAADAACYYVFNADGGRGYVIVSGDDRTVPVLGYSLTGSYNPDSIPENMRAWLQGYADEIEALDSMGVTEKYQTSDSRTKAPGLDGGNADGVIQKIPEFHAIQPLLKSKWNQGLPYNISCPVGTYTDEKGDERYVFCATGCVATAIAQVMYYHRWPSTVMADIPAYTTSDGLSMDGISAGTSIDWDGMSDTYKSYGALDYTGCTLNEFYSVASEAGWGVGNLMSMVGTSVRMNYGINASGTSDAYIAPALRDYFGYDENIYRAERSRYSIAEWDALIYNELACNRPVIYGAQSTGGGHQFVIDGHDGNEYYHVNWGWGGLCDGYFAIAVLNPYSTSGTGASSTPDGYSMGQAAIIGVQPPGMSNPVVSAGMEDRMSTEDLGIDGTFILATWFNLSGKIASFDIALEVTDMKDGSLYTIVDYGSIGVRVCGSGVGVACDVSRLHLPSGTYKIYPVSRISGTSQWLNDQNPDVTYVLAKVDASGTANLELYPQTELSVTHFEMPVSPSVGNWQTIKATVSNRGNGECNRTLYFLAQPVDESEVKFVMQTGAVIAAGGSSEIELFLNPERRVNHRLWLVTDYDVESSSLGDIVKIDESKVIGEALMIMGTQDRIPGDVDGDGHTGFEDVERLSRYVADGDESNIVKDNADVNGDGRIDAADVMEIILMMTNGN